MSEVRDSCGHLIRRSLEIAARDVLDGYVTRAHVAEAIVQSLTIPTTAGKALSLQAAEGPDPGSDPVRWAVLFAQGLEEDLLVPSSLPPGALF